MFIFFYFKKETSLCKRFTKFVIKNDLMTSDSLIVPIGEEIIQAESSSESEIQNEKEVTQIEADQIDVKPDESDA